MTQGTLPGLQPPWVKGSTLHAIASDHCHESYPGVQARLAQCPWQCAAEGAAHEVAVLLVALTGCHITVKSEPGVSKYMKS